jgi:hypothetical protein
MMVLAEAMRRLLAILALCGWALSCPAWGQVSGAGMGASVGARVCCSHGGAAFQRPLARRFRGRFRGQRSFSSLLAFPFFDDSEPLVLPQAPAPQVIVVRDEHPREDPVSLPAAKMIEVPLPVRAHAVALPPAVLVLHGGQQVEVSRYTILGAFLYDSSRPRQTSRIIPLQDLDLEATVRLNAARGIAFQLPVDSNEVVVRF